MAFLFCATALCIFPTVGKAGFWHLQAQRFDHPSPCAVCSANTRCGEAVSEVPSHVGLIYEFCMHWRHWLSVRHLLFVHCQVWISGDDIVMLVLSRVSLLVRFLRGLTSPIIPSSVVHSLSAGVSGKETGSVPICYVICGLSSTGTDMFFGSADSGHPTWQQLWLVEDFL